MLDDFRFTQSFPRSQEYIIDECVRDCHHNWGWIQTSNYPLFSIKQNSLNNYTLYAIVDGLNTIKEYSNNQYQIRVNIDIYTMQTAQMQLFNRLYILMKPGYPVNLMQENCSTECIFVVNVNQVGE